MIMARANHYLLDAVCGGCVSILAYRWNTILLNLGTVEKWIFWLARQVMTVLAIDGQRRRLIRTSRTSKSVEKESFSRMLFVNEDHFPSFVQRHHSPIQQV